MKYSIVFMIIAMIVGGLLILWAFRKKDDAPISISEFDKHGFNKDGYGLDGYNIEGTDMYGFNPDGYGLDGYTIEGVDSAGNTGYGMPEEY